MKSKLMEKYYLSKMKSKLNKNVVPIQNYIVSIPKYKIDIDTTQKFNETCEAFLKGYNQLELITVKGSQKDCKNYTDQGTQRSKMNQFATLLASVFG